MPAFVAAIGRILLAVIFVVSGFNKLLNVDATDQMMTAANLPSGLALPVGIFEVLAGLCLAFGVLTRLASVLLAGFTALATLFFHREVTDPMQLAMAMKNLAIIGGLMLVFAYGQMRWSYDHMRAARRGEVEARRQELRAHEAELRAARAEGRLDATTTADGVVVDQHDHVVRGHRAPWLRRFGFR